MTGDAPIFPNEDDPSRSRSRHCFSEWWRRAAKPVADIRVRLLSRGGTPPIEVELETDASGAAVFCELPPNRPLIAVGPGGAILLSEFTLSRNQLASRQLWIAR